MKRDASSGLALAMDIGTSSLRTALFTLEGRRLEATTSQQAYTLRTSAEGAAELSPAALLAAANKALTQTFARQGAERRLRDQPILVWGASCFWHSLLGVDARLTPLTPIYTWADSRCAPDAARLRREFSEAEVHARTGCMLRASFWPAKLAWLRRTQKPLVHRVAHWISPIDYLAAQFCGRFQPGISMTSGTGLVGLAGTRWDADLARAVGFQPDYDPSSAGEEPLLAAGAFARRFPALRATPFFAAIGDGAASNLGSGATARRLAAINYGTSAAMRIVRAGAYQPAPFGIFCYAIDERRWLLGGATSNAGNAHHWASEVFRVPAREAAAEQHPAAGEGLVVLPFLNGERAPTWCEDLPAVLLGMRQSHTALDLRRAFGDATLLRLAQIVAPLEKAAGGRLRFIVSGGLSRSSGSVARLINALNRPCRCSHEPEASLRGAAVFALERAGHRPEAAGWSDEVKPEAAAARVFARARRRQTILEEGLHELAARLRDIPTL